MSKDNRPEHKTVFICQQCGKESLKWLGHCPNCQEWNSFAEQTVVAATPSFQSTISTGPPLELSQIVIKDGERLPLPLNEFNRVLGGGLVAGSLILIGGDPGVGKSTLLLQVADLVAQIHGTVVYVSGEETQRQIKLRAERLSIKGEGLFLLAETNLEAILNQIEELSPNLVVIDSIQAIFSPELNSTSGSINQVRECTIGLMHWAKRHAVPIFLVGHVTKDGAIAGPRVLEHIVDVVLYLEGETFSPYRLLRSVKNRFGSSNEVGVFEMKIHGLVEVANPSQAFLSQRGNETIGSVVVPTFEGSRPLMIEIQALTSPTSFGLPRRTANGVDFNRLLLITAVLSRRTGLKLGNQDILVNVAGGLKISEPAADLGIALAIISSFRNTGIAPQAAAVGEVGLNGELRVIPQLDRRVNEATRLGFKRCLIPKTSSQINVPSGIELVPVSTLREAMRVGLVIDNPEE
ncbi:MAG: DNA repair protein RadA [Dehalococcoidales bacterium]|nr:DNA repair protein RadA [Dehalococcoidales bacterium]MDP6737670.1 DNA repair protein RadA [Dehalococcoidales bacterium]